MTRLPPKQTEYKYGKPPVEGKWWDPKANDGKGLVIELSAHCQEQYDEVCRIQRGKGWIPVEEPPKADAAPEVDHVE